MSMVMSMTGYGSAQSGSDSFSVDIKTVNQRFLEVSVKLPAGLESLEPLIQKEVRAKLIRGRCDVVLSRKNGSSVGRAPLFDAALFTSARELLEKELGHIAVDTIEREKMIVRELLSRGDILRFQEAEAAASMSPEVVLPIVVRALDQVVEMRRREGEALKGVLVEYLGKLDDFLAVVTPLTEEFVQKFRERVGNRLKTLELPVDAERLASEVAILADRTDVTEELERMRSHLNQFRGLLEQGGEIGKRLDFLVQELGREVNTIGSKAQAGKISANVVETKAVLEKIREQVQNIE